MRRSDDGAGVARPVPATLATLAVLATLVLTGCSAGGPETTSAPPVQRGLTTAPSPAPESYPDVLPTTGPEATVIPPDTGGPPVAAATIAGLDQAVNAAAHPSLSVCGGHFASVVVGRGDLRGTGATEYLLDTTCAGSTGTSPDEVSIYGAREDAPAGAGTTLTRTLVVYAFTANRPRITTYPYLAGPHLVVLQFSDGAQFSLVGLTPTGIEQGPLENA